MLDAGGASEGDDEGVRRGLTGTMVGVRTVGGVEGMAGGAGVGSLTGVGVVVEGGSSGARSSGGGSLEPPAGSSPAALVPAVLASELGTGLAQAGSLPSPDLRRVSDLRRRTELVDGVGVVGFGRPPSAI